MIFDKSDYEQVNSRRIMMDESTARKAESIEQIREHLEKGGRVKRLGLDVDIPDLDGAVMTFFNQQKQLCQVALHDDEVARWELLPIDDLPGIDASTLPVLTEDPTGDSVLPRDQGRICNELPRGGEEPVSEKYAIYGKAERVACDLEYFRNQLSFNLIEENPRMILLAISDIATRARELAEKLLVLEK